MCVSCVKLVLLVVCMMCDGRYVSVSRVSVYRYVVVVCRWCVFILFLLCGMIV